MKTASRREIMEEVGLAKGDLQNLTLCGYIFSNASEVDSVHVGMVYCAETEKESLTCLEDGKLTGAWLTPHELIVLNCEGKLESWSRIVYDAMLREGASYGL